MKKLTTLLNSLYFHQIWLLLTVVFFLILGGGFLSRNIYQKLVLIKDMKEVTVKLQAKADYLDEVLGTLNNMASSLRILEEDLVSPLDIPEYMMDLVLACSKAGYSVDSFYPISTADVTEYEVDLKLTGFREPVYLLESIESIPRITNITRLSIQSEGIRKTLSMSVTVLSGNEQ